MRLVSVEVVFCVGSVGVGVVVVSGDVFSSVGASFSLTSSLLVVVVVLSPSLLSEGLGLLII